MEILTRVMALCLCLVTLATGLHRDSSVDMSNLDTTLQIESTETASEDTVELNNVPVLYSDITYIRPITSQQALELQATITNAINTLANMCATGEYTDEAIYTMTQELSRLESISDILDSDICRFMEWEVTYPYATQVWYFLRGNGISEEVTAGIIGNMMMETSGGTLSLNPYIYGAGHYGLCQWSLYYKPFMRGASIEYQLEFLLEDMQVEFATFGFLYKKNFTYEDFLALETPEDAAIAFVKVYERPGDNSNNARKRASRDAYNYFTSGVQ